MDQSLHFIGSPDVRKILLTILSSGLDLEIPRTDQPFENRLMEVDVVHALQRDGDPALDQDT
ncbi:MAG: hypothetical protein RLZ37_678 [Actinomycetota bacterium]